MWSRWRMRVHAPSGYRGSDASIPWRVEARWRAVRTSAGCAKLFRSMILRDPVHGLVAFEGEAERVIERLLATREVQRLRGVRQLGLTSLVFPGAEHTRFAHSLGAAHVMLRMLARMRA